MIQNKSLISNKVQKGLKSNIGGKGLFANERISEGEVVAIKRGRVVNSLELAALDLPSHIELQINRDQYLVPVEGSSFEENMIYINHSCAPNVGMLDATTFVTIREVNKDEELVIDYAMIDDNDQEMKCNCKTSDCRKVITGKDWQPIDLQQKYSDFFSPFIKNRLKA